MAPHSHRYLINPSIVYREEENGAFLFDPDTGNLKFMNRAACEVYQFLQSRHSIDDIVEMLSKVYPEVDTDQLRSDTTVILDSLMENRFIASDLPTEA